MQCSEASVSFFLIIFKLIILIKNLQKISVFFKSDKDIQSISEVFQLFSWIRSYSRRVLNYAETPCKLVFFLLPNLIELELRAPSDSGHVAAQVLKVYEIKF